MLTAKRKSDDKKVIGEEIVKDKNVDYYCEFCHKKVIHNKSKSKTRIGHFKHAAGESHCPNNTSESLSHMRIKKQIFDYLKSKNYWSIKVLELEKWICDNTIRSDIYIETSKSKIGIEIQASKITVDEIKRRTIKYTKNDIAVFWVLPFDFGRFFQSKYNREYEEFEHELKEKVRLIDMELFLYWANFKKLLFWQERQYHSNSFIAIEFNEYKTADIEFYRDGDEHYYKGKKTKVMKSPIQIEYDIEFDQLKMTKVNTEFSAPYRNYTIPKRTILTYERKKRIR